MILKHTSYFKDPINDLNYFRDWVKALEKDNDRKYEELELETSLGTTHVWG
jgi:hypothetical protein